MSLLLTKVSREAKFCSVGCCAGNGSEECLVTFYYSSSFELI